MTEKQFVKRLVKCKKEISEQRDELGYLLNEADKIFDGCTEAEEYLKNAIDALSKRL